MGSGLFGDEILTERKKGALLLLSAYMLWGVLPIYWKALFSLDPVEILAHRILWSMVIAFITVAAQKKFRQTAEIILHDHKTMLALSAASLMITFNWGLFIWAVNNGMILATSLGYFINPLMSIVFGMVFFHEKLSRPQRFAIILAVTGVCSEIVSVGRLPYVSLALALSFGSYGVIKKLVKAEAMVGLFIETLVGAPFALFWLIHAQQSGTAHFPYNIFILLLLIGTGVVTNIPLAFFAYALRRIPLTMAGFIQYASPTLTFIIGIFVYGEKLAFSRIITFAFIWTALAIYTADTFLRREQRS